MCSSSFGDWGHIWSIRSPRIRFCTSSPRSNRVSGVVVDCPGSGSSMPLLRSTSFVMWRKSNTLAIPT